MQDCTPIQLEIARQLHNAKPDHLKPGVDVFFAPKGDDALLVLLDDHAAWVRYDEGPDTYTVKVGGRDEVSDVYCDQLGGLIFGDDAKPWDEPFGYIISYGDDGQAEVKFF